MSTSGQEWGKGEVLRLISLYESETVLWDLSNSKHKNANKRRDAIGAIADALNRSSSEVEKKISVVRSQYFREKAKVMKSKKSGAGSDDVYTPKWFAYKHLSFLSPAVEPLTHISSLNSTEEMTEVLEESINEEGPFPHTPEEFGNSTSNKNQPLKRKLKEKPVNGGKKEPITYEMAKEAFYALRNIRSQVTPPQKKDEFDTFGECVAHTLRNLKTHSAKVHTKHEINNILFQAELGLYDAPPPDYSRQPSTLSLYSNPSVSLNPSPAPSSLTQENYNDTQPQDNNNLVAKATSDTLNME